MDLQSFSGVFSLLPEAENPKQTFVDGIPYVLHEDHRWLLPIVHFAQQAGTLPKPCTVIMFDRHHDALDPPRSASDELKQLRAKPTLQGVVSLCEKSLRKTDDDWLKAGMELGFFGDAVIFGVEDDFEKDNFRFYQDHQGKQHRIEMTWRPRSNLAYQGHLSDLCRRSEFEPMWKILGWEIAKHRFQFLPGLPKILLTIDLDCFAIAWTDYMFEWPIKVFECEFLKPSSYRSTEQWTGRSFLQELAKKAGLVTFERESGCCGGTQDSQGILESLIHYGFDDGFSF
jgi:hypothetical protein